jgi:RNA polymerase sigma-70 factor, ECF subfamily
LTDERTLIDRISRGSVAAFTALYRSYQGRIYRLARQLSGSSSLADDVTQEVFLAVMRNPQAFDPNRGTVGSWLYGITHRQVLRALDRRGPGVPAAAADAATGHPAEPPDAVGDPSDPETTVSRSQRLTSLQNAIRNLPMPYREVVVLIELHEMSYDAAARILDCPIGTVRSRLHRARLQLGKALTDSGGSKVQQSICRQVAP